MIIKSLSRKSGTGQLLNYVFKYVSQESKVGQQAEPFLIRHNLRGKDTNSFIQAFKENEVNRLHKRSDATAVNHVIISWSNLDKEFVTEAMMKDIANKFIEVRGENTMVAGTAHYDRDHTHLHLVVSGSQLNGKSSRISREEFANLKVTLDAYQREKYPDLSHSLPAHGRSKAIKEKEVTLDQRSGRTSTKEQLLQLMNETFSTAKSKQSFLEVLSAKGYQPYYRADALTGVQLENGRKFRFKTLGYDEDKMQQLGSIENIEKTELDALDHLRTYGAEQERLLSEINVEQLEDTMNTSLESELDELDALRYEDEERELRPDSEPYGFDEEDYYSNEYERAEDLETLRYGAYKGARGKSPTR